MKRLVVVLVTLALAAAALAVGCAPASAPPPTAALAAPTKAVVEPTKAPVAQPTAVPAKKVDYPAGKPISLIIPTAAGGATDIGARVLAVALEKQLGAPVQVVNKSGANMQTGSTELAKSKPDGYTIGVTNLPTILGSYLDPERKAAYGRKDFVQVANQVVDPDVITVRAESPYKTLKDLLEAAKAQPDKISIGTGGFQSADHMALLVLRQVSGAQLRLVHFPGGGGEAMPALLGGHVEAMTLTLGTYASYFKNGSIRFLGVMDDQRSKFLPDLPTFKEQGYNVSYGSSRGISVPTGTPKEIVDILDGAIKKAMDTDEMKKKMEDVFLPARYMSSSEYTAYWDKFEAQTAPLLELSKKEQK